MTGAPALPSGSRASHEARSGLHPSGIDPSRKHKFGAQRTECVSGHSHPSKGEAGRCDQLRLLEKAGEISRLEREVKFPVFINGIKVFTYRADFVYFANNARVVEDFKGAITPVYRLKKKCVEAHYPGMKIVEVRR